MFSRQLQAFSVDVMKITENFPRKEYLGGKMYGNYVVPIHLINSVLFFEKGGSRMVSFELHTIADVF